MSSFVPFMCARPDNANLLTLKAVLRLKSGHAWLFNLLEDKIETNSHCWLRAKGKEVVPA